MKLIALKTYGQYTVVLRQDDKGNPLPVEPFVVGRMARFEDGEVIDWAYGHYFNNLFLAVDYARSHGNGIPNHYRLEEIASKAIDGLIEDDEESAYEYFANEMEMDEHEAEYFGLDVEKFYKYK